MKTASVISALCLSSAANAFQHHGGRTLKCKNRASAREMKSSTWMESEEGSGSGTGRRFEPASQQQPYNYNDRAHMTSLYLSTLEGLPDSAERASMLPQLNIPNMGSDSIDAITKVLSASLLITGNTVGSSMFVLPDAVAGLGMVWGSSLFFGLYIYNLISGLLLAEVAINLHESSDCDVPSSFKDFVDTALKSEVAGTVMSGASLLSNSCFLAFGTVQAGSLLVDTFPGYGLTPIMGASAFTAVLALFSLTQTNKGLETIANAAVMVLFSSFASVLLPSVAHISDPVGTLLAPGTNPDGFATAIAAAVPLLLSSLTYQNIVPSITKLLDFDRTKSTIAIAIGSAIPMIMYIAWCYCVLGGGLDNSMASGAGAAAFTAFSASALIGSSLAAVMSLAEEYESIIASVVEDDIEVCPVQDKFSIPAVALSMVPPAAVAFAFAEGGDLTGALHFNGAVITPFLYGLLPIILYQSMQKKGVNDENLPFSLSLPQVLLGAGTIGALGQEIIDQMA
mmetsp:Transcript_22717/g.40682  ORF Transcript_22717/g.40682 Transcript_22717/m.40682 type:complete len:510 (-) Transcript_22717:76-1605(-)